MYSPNQARYSLERDSHHCEGKRWGVVRGGEVGCGKGRGVEVKREGDRREACLEEQVSAVLTS